MVSLTFVPTPQQIREARRVLTFAGRVYERRNWQPSFSHRRQDHHVLTNDATRVVHSDRPEKSCNLRWIKRNRRVTEGTKAYYDLFRRGYRLCRRCFRSICSDD